MKIEELRVSIEENDPAAVDLCRNLISILNLETNQKSNLLEVMIPLEAFEFDQAKEIIQKLP